MIIDIPLNDFYDILKKEHNDEEIAEIIQKYFIDYDSDNFLDDYFDSPYYVKDSLSNKIIENFNLDEIISDYGISDETMDFITNYIENHSIDEITSTFNEDDICKILDKYVDYGEISCTGVFELYKTDGEAIEHFSDIPNEFVWYPSRGTQGQVYKGNAHLEELVEWYIKQYSVEYDALFELYTTDLCGYLADFMLTFPSSYYEYFLDSNIKPFFNIIKNNSEFYTCFKNFDMNDEYETFKEKALNNEVTFDEIRTLIMDTDYIVETGIYQQHING
ncbi:MAG: hypothetical protein VZS44_12190 [Bacilli bacterium]|nr:hypothetical protein [Bacilli bacterium]